MKRNLLIVSIMVLLFGVQTVFAQRAGAILPEPVFLEDTGEFLSGPARPVMGFSEQNDVLSFLWNFGLSGDALFFEPFPLMTIAQAASSDAAVPRSIRNNRFFLESVRLNNLAHLAYEEGDFESSTGYSMEAVRYAELSDDYVALQLKIRETDNAISAARRRIDYAASINAAAQYPSEYRTAQTAYDEARQYRSGERWDDAISAADRVIAFLANIERTPENPAAVQSTTPPVTPSPSGTPLLPAQYTVRPWSVSRDCLWNIAGRPWVYNDPNQWRVLYEANRARMPQPDNPDLIHPDMVLNIPSLKGETRQGMWDPNANYTPFR